MQSTIENKIESPFPFEEKSEPLHPARKFLDYLGFKKDGEGWKDKHDCFIYDNKVPSELKDLVAIQNGTAHNRGFQKGKLVCKESKENKEVKGDK